MPEMPHVYDRTQEAVLHAIREGLINANDIEEG